MAQDLMGTLRLIASRPAAGVPCNEPTRPRMTRYVVSVTEELSASGRAYFVAVMREASTDRELAWSAGATKLEAVSNATRLAEERHG